MPRPRLALLTLPAAAVVAALTFLVGSGAASPPPIIDRGNGHAHLPNGKLLQHASAGAEVTFDEEREEAADDGAGSADLPPDASASALGCANRGTLTNPRVNQDCTARRQAEEQIAVNPTDANNVIAGQNDSRIGFNHCGFAYSLDGGATWGDGQPGFFQHLSPIGHTYDAAADPGVTFDGNGQAWFSCVTFDMNSNASAVMAVPSTPALKGAAYANVEPGPPPGNAPSPYVVVEDASGAHFYDKPFIAADPNSTAVYVTFTDFQVSTQCKKGGNRSGFCQSPIFISKWTGTGWTAPLQISGQASFCTFGNFFSGKIPANSCNFDQGSFPVVLPNGDVYVVFNNANTPSANTQNPVLQTLGVHVHVSGNTLTADPPVRVGGSDERFDAFCDFGRGPEPCIDSLDVRTDNFPALALDPTDGSHLVAVWQDTRDGSANDLGRYDVVVSESTDGGATWSDSSYSATGGGVAPLTSTSAYFEPSVAITPASGDVVVSTYQANTARHASTVGDGTYGYGYLVDSGSGFGSYIPASDGQSYPSPEANVDQKGFLGDYSSIAADPSGDVVHLAWADTRNVSETLGPDEDVFTAKIDLAG
jgi:hypothetical protein